MMIGEIDEVNGKSLVFEPAAKPVPAEERARLLVDPGFGRVFTDPVSYTHLTLPTILLV